MGIISFVVGSCSCASVAKALTLLTGYSTSHKIVDKVVVPVGTFCIASMVGDATGKYAEQRIQEMKKECDETVEKIRKKKAAMEAANGQKPENIVHNIFEETATRWSEDGKPIAGRYPYESNNEEEVKENGEG